MPTVTRAEGGSNAEHPNMTIPHSPLQGPRISEPGSVFPSGGPIISVGLLHYLIIGLSDDTIFAQIA
jgi:hypothetical protein